MTDTINIHKLERLLAKTTWGVWQITGINSKYIEAFHPVTGKPRYHIGEFGINDMEFVVEARAAMPNLIRTVVDQDALIQHLRKRVRDLEEQLATKTAGA